MNMYLRHQKGLGTPTTCNLHAVKERIYSYSCGFFDSWNLWFGQAAGSVNCTCKLLPPKLCYRTNGWVHGYVGRWRHILCSHLHFLQLSVAPSIFGLGHPPTVDFHTAPKDVPTDVLLVYYQCTANMLYHRSQPCAPFSIQISPISSFDKASQDETKQEVELPQLRTSFALHDLKDRMKSSRP